MPKFTIPGEPKAQGRPRFARHGKFVRTYDPKESTDFKSRVAFFATQSGILQIEGAIALTVDVYVKRPKIYAGKRWPEGRLRCAKRPDWDNFGKAVSDALKGIAYADDGQIWDGRCRKWYHEKAGAPRVEVEINGENEDDPATN